jgi:hypothetical protein
MGEVPLALVADAWSRTYRSNVTTYAAWTEMMESRNGVRIIPDLREREWVEVRRVSMVPDRRLAGGLDQCS